VGLFRYNPARFATSSIARMCGGGKVLPEKGYISNWAASSAVDVCQVALFWDARQSYHDLTSVCHHSKLTAW